MFVVSALVFWSPNAPRSPRGGRKREDVLPFSTLCLHLYWLCHVFCSLALSSRISMHSRLLSHTGQLSSLYRACVIFCTHVCPSDHCDRQCVSYALNKNESRKKKCGTASCLHSQNVSGLHRWFNTVTTCRPSPINKVGLVVQCLCR